jgi:NAD(P)H-dependent FMN reductase
MAVEILDLRDYALPFLADSTNPSHRNGVYGDEAIDRFAHAIKKFDGYIIITPEYNRSTSGVLKNALDLIYGEFANKPVAFISYGSVGGARAVEQLRLIAVEHQMAPIRNGVHILAPWTLRNEDGTLKDGALDGYLKSAEAMLEQLSWWARALMHTRD